MVVFAFLAGVFVSILALLWVAAIYFANERNPQRLHEAEPPAPSTLQKQTTPAEDPVESNEI